MPNYSKLGQCAALALVVLPGVAMAEFAPPKGCETFLTVQSKECAVSNLYRCDVAPDGHWEAVFSIDGLESLTAYDAKYQWLDAQYAWDTSRETFVAPAEDAIDIDALISEGVDTFRFTMRRKAPDEARDITIVGADILTERHKMIDGKLLRIVTTDLQILSENGTVEYQARGQQYLDEEARLFFLGPDQVFEPDGAVSDYDGSPVNFIEPGEKGFGATIPIHDCPALEASFTPQ